MSMQIENERWPGSKTWVISAWVGSCLVLPWSRCCGLGLLQQLRSAGPRGSKDWRGRRDGRGENEALLAVDSIFRKGSQPAHTPRGVPAKSQRTSEFRAAVDHPYSVPEPFVWLARSVLHSLFTTGNSFNDHRLACSDPHAFHSNLLGEQSTPPPFSAPPAGYDVRCDARSSFITFSALSSDNGPQLTDPARPSRMTYARS